jgi:hypothetical protein
MGNPDHTGGKFRLTIKAILQAGDSTCRPANVQLTVADDSNTG